MWCWGQNYYGQLGDGTTQTRPAPVAVGGLGTGVVALAAGADHTCAVTSAGIPWCWGANSSGQLGDCSATSRSAPVAVYGLGYGVVGVAAGDNHSCAVTIGGAAWCWGQNYNGQLGNGTTTSATCGPVGVSGLGSGVAAISGGVNYTCARTGAGALMCWGSNWQGQLGDGTTNNRTAPVAVTGLSSGVAIVDAGESHSCAVTSEGALWCWGDNDSGQVGDFTTTQRLTPVRVLGFRPAASDVNGDSRSDVVWRHATGGDLWLWSMSDGSPTAQTYLGTITDTAWQIHGLRDQTRDGKADLLWRHATSGVLYLWTMDGSTVAAEQYIGAVDPAYGIVGAHDYTGDGRSDILWRHQVTGELWLWQMNGAALEAVTRVATVAPAYALVGPET